MCAFDPRIERLLKFLGGFYGVNDRMKFSAS